MDKPQIKVFITKTREFRAKIKENSETPTYEVTIGGESWNNGKGKNFENEIRIKCKKLLDDLTSKMIIFNK